MPSPTTKIVESIDLHSRATELKDREQASRISIWESPSDAATKPTLPAVPIEQEIIAVIVKPIAPDEGHRAGNDRKERELSALFDRISPAVSLALSQRLARATAGDVLVAAFGRLVVERRMRLLAKLQRQRAIAVTQAQRTHRR